MKSDDIVQVVLTTTTPRLLRIEEVGEQLSCGRSHVYVLIGRGDLAAVKVGRLRRITQESVDAYIARLVRALA